MHFPRSSTVLNGHPLHWREMLSSSHQGSPQPSLDIKLPSGKVLGTYSVSAKTLSELITLGRSIILPQKKWETSVDVRDQEEWKQHYTRAFKVTRETKTQAFQYRGLTRTITCNHYLKRIRIKEEGSCSFCNQEDTLALSLVLPNCKNILGPDLQMFSLRFRCSLTRLTLKDGLLGVPRG